MGVQENEWVKESVAVLSNYVLYSVVIKLRCAFVVYIPTGGDNWENERFQNDLLTVLDRVGNGYGLCKNVKDYGRFLCKRWLEHEEYVFQIQECT